MEVIDSIDDSVITSTDVEEGSSVSDWLQSVEVNQHEGYNFNKFSYDESIDLDNVTEDITITAEYEAIVLNVKLIDGFDGSEIDTFEPKYGSNMYYVLKYNTEYPIHEGYIIDTDSWLEPIYDKISNIKEDITITVTYKEVSDNDIRVESYLNTVDENGLAIPEDEQTIVVSKRVYEDTSDDVTKVSIIFSKEIPTELYESYTVTKSKLTTNELTNIEISGNTISFYDSDINDNNTTIAVYNIGLYKDYNVSICKDLVDAGIYPIQIKYTFNVGNELILPIKFIDYSESVIWGDYTVDSSDTSGEEVAS